MTDTTSRPIQTPTLASQVPTSATHRSRLWPEFFGRREITCTSCAWSKRGTDLADLVAAAVNHSPRVVVVDEAGEELADGAELQTEARERWDAGGAITVGEAIKERLNGQEERDVDEDQDDDSMSARIRRGAAAGSQLSRSLGRRFAEATGEEHDDSAEEREEAARALEVGRARSRRARGLPEELEEEPEAVDVNKALRGAVRARRAATARAFEERLFGEQDEAGDDAGGGGDAA